MKGTSTTIFHRCHTTLLAICLLALSAVVMRVPAGVIAAQATTAQEQLAQRYVPVAYLRKQLEPCAKTPDGGEPYVPAAVEIVFDDPAVTLRQAGPGKAEDDPVLVVAPSAADLAAAPEDAYLDFPGNPRDPGCDYERHARDRAATLGLAPTTYAHIVLDEANRRLALQYWFFTYFNDWNNTHESDWEMIQLMWEDVGSVEEALSTDPVQVGYAQHGGGELAMWGDAKLTIEDETHLAVYPAAGSHASFFGSHTYIGWGENGTGFGCDVTTQPHTRVPLAPVLVPNDPDSTGPFAWLLFDGRWGERQPSHFNGPKGPNAGQKWNDPWGAVEDWRDSSLKVPESTTVGPTATDLFCTLSAAGSQVVIYAGAYPWLAIGVLALLAVVVVVAGKAWIYLGDSVRLYRRHWRLFLGIGLLAIPIGLFFNGLQLLLVTNPPMEWLLTWLDGSAGAHLAVAMIVGGVQQVAMLLLIGPAAIQAVRHIREDRPVGVVESYRQAWRHLGQLAGALLLLVLVASALLITIAGLPVALWLLIRWQFFGQAVIFRHATGSRSALSVSARAVTGQWWRGLAFSLAIQALGALPGPLIGVLLLLGGKTSVAFANGVSSFLFALTVPLTVVALTLFYLRLRGEPLPELQQSPQPDSALVSTAVVT